MKFEGGDDSATSDLQSQRQWCDNTCGLWGSRAGKSRWDGNWSRRRSTAMTSLLFHNNHSVLRLDDDGDVSQRVLFEVEVFLMYIRTSQSVIDLLRRYKPSSWQFKASILFYVYYHYCILYNYYYCTISTSTSTATIEIVSLAENWTMLLKYGTCWPWDGYAEDCHLTPRYLTGQVERWPNTVSCPTIWSYVSTFRKQRNVASDVRAKH